MASTWLAMLTTPTYGVAEMLARFNPSPLVTGMNNAGITIELIMSARKAARLAIQRLREARSLRYDQLACNLDP